MVVGALVVIVALVIVYVIALGRLTPGDAVAGALWAAVFIWWFRAHVMPDRLAGWTAGRAARTVLVFAVGLGRGFAGAADVLRRALGRTPGRGAAIIDVDYADRSETGAAVSALLDSISPGSVVVDLDGASRVMAVHVMDGARPDAHRQERQRFYRRWQRSALP